MSNVENDFILEDRVLRFNDPVQELRPTRVTGRIIPQTNKGEELMQWKKKVACTVMNKRGATRWCPKLLYAVTLHFCFRWGRSTTPDVDNCIKPVLDGLAAGLFLPEEKDIRELRTFAAHPNGVDDSGFRVLLVHGADKAQPQEEDEVRLFVSSTRHVSSDC